MATAFGYDDGLDYKKTGNETRRLLAATAYLEKQVWPKFTSAQHMISQPDVPPATVEIHDRAFPGGIPSTAARIARSLRTFSNEVGKELDAENRKRPQRPNLKDDLQRLTTVEATLTRLEKPISA